MGMKSVVAALRSPAVIDEFFQLLEANQQQGGLYHGLCRVTSPIEVPSGDRLPEGTFLARLTTEGRPDHPNNPLYKYSGDKKMMFYLGDLPVETVPLSENELQSEWATIVGSDLDFSEFKKRYGSASKLVNTEDLEPENPDLDSPAGGWTKAEILAYAEETR